MATKRKTSNLSEFYKISESYGISSEQIENQLQWVEISLENTPAIAEKMALCEIVIHAAGMISYLKKDRQKLIFTNAYLTGEVVNAALASNIKKFIYISSISTLSSEKDKPNVDESNVWDEALDHSFYGYSKYKGECEVWRGAEEGLNTVILNPGIILGFGDWNHGSNRLFRNTYRQFPIYSTGITGFVGVYDVVRATLLCCEKEVSNERFLLVSENLSFQKVNVLMAKYFGKKPSYVRLNAFLYQLTLNFVRVKEFLGFRGMLTVETVKSSINKRYFSNKKIKKVLDFEFEKMDKALSNSIEQFLKKK